MDRLLSTVLAQVCDREPDREIDIVVTPSRGDRAEELVRLISDIGASYKMLDRSGIQCKLPANRVSELVDSDLVSRARLARLHHMH